MRTTNEQTNIEIITTRRPKAIECKTSKSSTTIYIPTFPQSRKPQMTRKNTAYFQIWWLRRWTRKDVGPIHTLHPFQEHHVGWNVNRSRVDCQQPLSNVRRQNPAIWAICIFGLIATEFNDREFIQIEYVLIASGVIRSSVYA